MYSAFCGPVLFAQYRLTYIASLFSSVVSISLLDSFVNLCKFLPEDHCLLLALVSSALFVLFVVVSVGEWADFD